MPQFAFTKEQDSDRSFKNQPIEAEKMAAILKAGCIEPTVGNNQLHHIIVITTTAELAKVDVCTRCRFEAPVVLMVCYDKSICRVRKVDRAREGKAYAVIVTLRLMLAAWDHGLDIYWAMYFDPAKTAELFGLPENIVPVALLPIGYPSDNVKPFG